MLAMSLCTSFTSNQSQSRVILLCVFLFPIIPNTHKYIYIDYAYTNFWMGVKHHIMKTSMNTMKYETCWWWWLISCYGIFRSWTNLSSLRILNRVHWNKFAFPVLNKRERDTFCFNLRSLFYFCMNMKMLHLNLLMDVQHSVSRWHAHGRTFLNI